MKHEVKRQSRPRSEIQSDIAWVNARLADSQEHAQIVRLEERRQRLLDELKEAPNV